MKLNLASGQRPYKNWTNIDLIEQGYPVDIIADAKDLHMIDDESVDIIVAHHLLEHIAIHDLNEYIIEWRRVLKPGGVLSIHVPNLRKINKAWLEGKIDTYIHNVNTYGAYQGHVADLHKWGYDQQELDDRMRGWDGKDYKFEWECRGYNPTNPLYKDADIATDWWILNREYVK